MKATVSSSSLSAALGLVSRAVSPRSTLPILGNVLLETAEDGLRLTATNLDLTISATVPATVLEEGRTTVPARLLSEYISSLGDAPCSIELDPATQVLRLQCGVHKANLHGIDAVEFPPLPSHEAAASIEADSVTLQNAITQTVMAASADEASPVLTGVLVQIDGKRLTLAATDRHRLAVKTIDVSVEGTLPVTSVIVPARHLNEVARAVTSQRPTVTIAFSESRNQVFFTLKDVAISSRLIEGTYPNYAQVIPGESTTVVSLPTAALLREARTAAVLARDAANPVRLQVGDGTLTLRAQTAEVGDDEAPLTATVKGDEVQIAFNARYVLDALSVLDSDEVQLSFNGALNPGVLRPAGREDYLCIIMPVRVA
ncbi:MAG: DNA polymerase III subunit beta [Candidatus Dormibacteraeota bacterium]|nr:DNA polymerase III subunit beta [Candidatus Dormibacteraeota bacterium]